MSLQMEPGAPAEWQGWGEMPEPSCARGWTDLTHPLTQNLPNPRYFPPPRIERVLSLPHDALNLTRLDTIVHYGTHLDAPNHFIADGPSIDQIPLARLWGPGVVWRIDASEDGVIEVDDLESAIPTVRRGDIVVLDTGWSAYIDDDRYERHPSLSEPGARWLVERGAKLVAFDTQTPDTPIYRRPPSFNFPVHHILLGSGVLIVENVTNHRALANQRIDVVLLPLAIAGSDGSPIRILARPAGSENEGSPHD